MSARARTAYFIGITAVAIAAWDVYTILSHGVETSISQLMIEWAYEYPAFPFLMGFTCGHLFWKISDAKKDRHTAEKL